MNLSAREFFAVWLFLTGFLVLLYADIRHLVVMLSQRGPGVSYKRLRFRGRLLLVVNGLAAACTLYGAYFEPYWLETNTFNHPVAAVKENSAAEIRILHLTDLHIEPPFERSERVLSALAGRRFDLVLLTGDYLNTMHASGYFRHFLRELTRLGPVYAVTGNFAFIHDCRPAFSGSGARLIENESIALSIKGIDIELIGVSFAAARTFRKLMQNRDTSRYCIMMYHSPDLMPYAARAGVDLYLTGHTHGGQIRLPWYGALVTMSRYGKRYEAGLYQDGGTRMYVSRGIGLEGRYAPRVRFLCRPEIAIHSLCAASR